MMMTMKIMKVMILMLRIMLMKVRIKMIRIRINSIITVVVVVDYLQHIDGFLNVLKTHH